MQIRIGNNLVFGEDSVYKISPNIEGLDSAAIRTGSGLYAGVDGGYVSSQLYGHRTIVFRGFFIGDCEDQEAYRKTLLTNLKIRKLFPIGITSFTGQHYATSGYVTDIKCAVTSPTVSEYQITLLCPDPVLYESDENNPLTPKWVQETLDGEAITTVNVLGTTNTYPIITTLPASNQTRIQFANNTTGEAFWLEDITDTGDTIVVDMGNRTVLQGMDSIANLRTLESRWWWLEPGNNEIAYWTDHIAGQTATLRYKVGYGGI